MQIDIIVDTICPWCYVGHARFRKALAMRPADTPELSWRPFQLNPRMPAEGMERQAYLAEKFRTRQRAERAHHNLYEAGGHEGIDFRFEQITRTPNTVDSHRLIALAGRAGRQGAVVDALFRAYFTDGRDIGDIDTLADIAAAAGLDRAETIAHLDSDLGRDMVVAEDDLVRNLGVNGVPCYIIDRKYAVSGAQSPEIFLQIFDLARHDGAAIAAE